MLIATAILIYLLIGFIVAKIIVGGISTIDRRYLFETGFGIFIIIIAWPLAIILTLMASMFYFLWYLFGGD